MQAGVVRKTLQLGLVMVGAVFACAQTLARTFEVVSVKPFDSVEDRVSIRVDRDTFEAAGVTMDDLVGMGYGLSIRSEVTGTPGALKGKRWTVHAKMDAETAEAMRTMKPAERDATENAMVLAMLRDRFQLKAHTVVKDGPVYALEQAKGGARLTETAKDANTERERGDDGRPKNGGGSMSVRNGTLEATDIPLENLTRMLQGQMQRKVLDETGLKGRYTFSLKWSRPGEGGKAAGEDENAPGLETALQEQLGLKLESKRGPVESVVVDNAAMPTED